MMKNTVDTLPQVYVYLQKKTKSNYTDGAVFAAVVISERQHSFILQLLTDSNGSPITDDFIVITSKGSLFTPLKKEEMPRTPWYFYHFPGKQMIEKRYYVKNLLKVNTIPSLALGSFAQYGAGIYGQYFPPEISEVEIVELMGESREMHKIMLRNPFVIKDRTMADLLTLTSLNLNLWLDKIILLLKTTLLTEKEITTILKTELPPEILANWNLVFTSSFTLTSDAFCRILTTYLNYYVYQPRYQETATEELLEVAPINALFNTLGYDGLLQLSDYGNRWNRGCVCYNFSSTDDFLQSNQEDHF